MSPDELFMAYLVIVLGAMTAVIFYYDLRRKRFEPMPSQDHVFRCRKCAFVYTDDADVDRSRCPQCRTVNQEITF